MKPSLARKFSRLAERMRDPEWRRFGRNLVLGKLLGLAALALPQSSRAHYVPSKGLFLQLMRSRLAAAGLSGQRPR